MRGLGRGYSSTRLAKDRVWIGKGNAVMRPSYYTMVKFHAAVMALALLGLALCRL